MAGRCGGGGGVSAKNYSEVGALGTSQNDGPLRAS